MRHHYVSDPMAKMKTLTTPVLARRWTKENLCTLLVKRKKATATLKNSLAVC